MIRRVLYLGSNGRLWFAAPNDGGGGGGGGSSAGGGAGASANGGGQQNGGGEGGGGETIKTPFDDLPWDELPDVDQARLRKAKDEFVATLQKVPKLEADLQKTQEDARRFQSETDRTKAELKRWKPSEEQSKDDPILVACVEELGKAGYSPEQAKQMAPVYAAMFARIGVIQREQIGHDLAPLAGTVLAQEAQSSFEAAYGLDTLGMLSIPEVATVAWNHVRDRVGRGENTSPDIVLNLAKMAYVDHMAEKGDQFTPPSRRELPVAPPIPGMRTGPSYPMAGGGQPIVNRPADPNAARTVLNDDTRNALASTFNQMAPDLNVLPKMFKTSPQGGRR